MISWLILVKVNYDQRLNNPQNQTQKPKMQSNRLVIVLLSLSHLAVTTYCTNRLVDNTLISLEQMVLIYLDVIIVNIFVALIVFRISQQGVRQEIIRGVLSDPIMRIIFFAILAITALVKVV
jgi:succinate dehydrogenase hydrophobic anchor subunit